MTNVDRQGNDDDIAMEAAGLTDTDVEVDEDVNMAEDAYTEERVVKEKEAVSLSTSTQVEQPRPTTSITPSVSLLPFMWPAFTSSSSSASLVYEPRVTKLTEHVLDILDDNEELLQQFMESVRTRLAQRKRPRIDE